MKTLVIATEKSFWASLESNYFPDRVHTWIVWGSSEDRFNTFVLVVRAWIRLWINRPKIVIVSQAARAAVWFSWLIRCGLVPSSKWIAIDPVYLHDRHCRFYDCILVYCRNQIRSRSEQLRDRFQYVPLPANGDFSGIKSIRGDYFVSIGIAYRDFKSLVGATRFAWDRSPRYLE